MAGPQPNTSAPSAIEAPSLGRSRKRLRVGVLDLLGDAPPRGWDRVYTAQFRRQFVSITPQAVSVWARRLGHRVSYATYYGQQLPDRLLPGDLDVVFIGAYTKASGLAYALARLFRRRGALTVLGGPHARAFPLDALRFFDLVVEECDRLLVDDILAGRFAPPAVVSSGRPLTEVPSVEERMPEILASSLSAGAILWKAVPVLSSVGCPYTCDFCVDWKNDYVRLPSEALEADLRYLAARHPGALVAYHDPNFGVQFDRTLDAIEGAGGPNPYAIESSLSILRGPRLERLRRTRCVYVAAGVESWADYSNKSGSGSRSGWDKLEKIVEHFRLLHDYIEGFQANFVFGTDADRGTEPLGLTKEFVRRLPFVWPGVNIPTPFGGTPLFDNLWREGRILAEMPFAFYYNPYLTFVPAHYTPIEYYRNILDLFGLITSARTWARRLTSGAHPLVKLLHSVQTFGMMQEMKDLRRIRALLEADPALRAFHEGRSAALPELYHRAFEAALGPYAELLTRADRIPRHAGPAARVRTAAQQG